MSKPILLVSEPDFRIVRVLSEGSLADQYVLEVEDGRDLLGVQRWREFRMDNKHLKQMFQYMIRMATKGAE